MGIERRSIWVTLTVTGFHFWPNAPASRAYLAEPHRHLFGIRAAVPVDHDDREVEFHDLQQLARHFLFSIGKFDQHTGAIDFGAKSCEMIAERLAQDLRDHLRRSVAVVVDEDGECGARVELGYP